MVPLTTWLLCQGNQQNAQLFWSIFLGYFWVSAQTSQSTWSHKFLASHQQINCMVSDDNGAHNLSWTKKKTFNSQSVTQLQFLIPFVEIIALFLFGVGRGFFEWMGSLLPFPVRLGNEFIGVLHTNYRWISGPYVRVIYAFNSIHCNPRFMGIHVHKSQEFFFILQFCDIKLVAKNSWRFGKISTNKTCQSISSHKCKNNSLIFTNQLLMFFKSNNEMGKVCKLQVGLEFKLCMFIT